MVDKVKGLFKPARCLTCGRTQRVIFSGLYSLSQEWNWGSDLTTLQLLSVTPFFSLVLTQMQFLTRNQPDHAQNGSQSVSRKYLRKIISTHFDVCSLSLIFCQRWLVHLKWTALEKQILKALISSGYPSVPNDLRFINSGFSHTSVGAK